MQSDPSMRQYGFPPRDLLIEGDRTTARRTTIEFTPITDCMCIEIEQGDERATCYLTPVGWAHLKEYVNG